MRVGILTQWYPPEPAQIPETLARGLRDRGHDVRVLTGYPNYPLGAIYPGFEQRLHCVETHDGIRVHRVPLYPSHDRSAARRIGSFMSFAASTTVLGQKALAGVEVVYVYHPPATAASLAVIKSWIGHTPFLLHVQDLWPDSVVEAGMLRPGMASRAASRGLSAWCDLVYRRAGAIAVISDGMRDVLISRGVPHDKVFRVYNWVDESVFRPRQGAGSETPNGEVGPVTVLYAGNFGEYQALDVAVRAAAALSPDEHFRLWLVGSGTQERALRSLVSEQDTENVVFLDRVPLEEVGVMSAQADAHLVSLRDLPMFRVTIPSKTQAALASGRPVVVAAPGEVANLVVSAGAGAAAAPGDPLDLTQAFRKIIWAGRRGRDRMGTAGRTLYDAEMSQGAGVAAIGERLEQLARHGTSAR